MSVCVCPLVDFWPIQGSSRPPCHRLSMKRVKKMEWMDGISMCTHVCLCVFSLGLGLRQRPRGCESLQLITESSSQRGGALLSPPTSWFIPQDAWLWIVTLRSSGRAAPLCPLCSRPAPFVLVCQRSSTTVSHWFWFSMSASPLLWTTCGQRLAARSSTPVESLN